LEGLLAPFRDCERATNNSRKKSGGKPPFRTEIGFTAFVRLCADEKNPALSPDILRPERPMKFPVYDLKIRGRKGEKVSRRPRTDHQKLRKPDV
jgi:hypothetical protein